MGENWTCLWQLKYLFACLQLVHSTLQVSRESVSTRKCKILGESNNSLVRPSHNKLSIVKYTTVLHRQLTEKNNRLATPIKMAWQTAARNFLLNTWLELGRYVYVRKTVFFWYVTSRCFKSKLEFYGHAFCHYWGNYRYNNKKQRDTGQQTGSAFLSDSG